MMNMRGIMRGGRDMDRTHAQLMGRRQIPGVIFEHGGLFGGQAIACKYLFKGTDFGFWLEIGVLDPIDRIKQPIQPACLDDALRIGGSAIGVYDFAPGQLGDLRSQFGIGRHMGQTDFVHVM